MKTINVGLVGYKFMGKAHSNAYRQVARFFPELEIRPVLKAICGRDEAGVKHAAEHGLGRLRDRLEALIARDDIDVIDVSTPGNLHAEISIAAAQGGQASSCAKSRWATPPPKPG